MSLRTTISGLLVVLLAPALLLAPCLLGPRTFVPFDAAEYAPTATLLDDFEFAAVRDGANHDPTELVLMFLPEWRLAGAELDAGRLPMWNPFARLGSGLFANAVTGLAYPPNWLLFAFDDPRDGLAWGAWLGLALAGALVFGFLRALGLGLPAVLLGALGYELSGTLAAQAYFYQRLAVLVWVPGLLWGVWAVHERVGRRSRLAAAGVAGCVAMTWLSGFPQFGAPALLVAGVVAVGMAVSRRARGRPLGPLGWSALAVVLGTAIAAYLLVPMAAFFPESSRNEPPTPDSLAALSLAPEGLLGWLMPTLFGPTSSGAELPYARSPLSLWLLSRLPWSAEGAPLPTEWSFIEGTVFAGTLAVPLALFAALRPRRGVERALTAVLVVLLVLSGGHAWMAWFHQLPGVREIVPMRYASLINAPLILLAACGFDRLLAERASARRRIIGAALFLAAAAALIGWQALRGMAPAAFAQGVADGIFARHGARLPGDMTVAGLADYLAGPDGRYAAAGHALLRSNLLRAGLLLGVCAIWWACIKRAARVARFAAAWRAVGVAGLAIELGVFASPLLAGRETPHALRGTPVHAFLRAERVRLAEVGGVAVVRATTAPAGQKVLPFAPLPGQLVPDRIRDLNAYTFVDRESARVFAKIWGDDALHRDVWPLALPDDARLQHPFLDVIGARYVLSESALAHAGERVGPRLRGSRLRGDGSAVEFFVYERENVLPRAFVVPALTVVDDLDAAATALADPSFDPRAAAFVARADAADLERFVTDPASAARGVRFVAETPQRIELEIDDGPAGWLVLADAWFSGWTVTVAGDQLNPLRANVALRAVPLPAGSQRVVFTYRAPGWWAGCLISLFGLCGVIALGWTRVVRRSPGVHRRVSAAVGSELP